MIFVTVGTHEDFFDRLVKEIDRLRGEKIILEEVTRNKRKMKLGETKINHAYAYGGPHLAIRTLNENFNLDIRDYVTVDFFNLEKIIDTMGGVRIDVENNEISLINSYMTEVATIEKNQ